VFLYSHYKLLQISTLLALPGKKISRGGIYAPPPTLSVRKKYPTWNRVKLLANSPFGVGGIKMGAMCSPLQDQLFLLFLCSLFLLTVVSQSLGLYKGLTPCKKL
jgi:hypothetical protein